MVSLNYEEIAIILNGAKALEGKGTRSHLVLMLKGSKNPKLLKLGVKEHPSYGVWNHMTMEEIDPMVDFCFSMGYLQMVDGYKGQVIAFTGKGNEILDSGQKGES